MSEETICNQAEDKTINDVVEDMGEKSTQEEKAQPEAPDAGKKKENGKIAGAFVIGGAAGLVLGMLTPVNLFPNQEEMPDESVDDPNCNGGQCTVPGSEIAPEPKQEFVGHDMPVAMNVEDTMSFNEAFATARHEVGAGGIFAWRGHSYGTYYANEWNAMSEEEHDQYWADVYHTSAKIDYDEPQTLTDDNIVETVPDGLEDGPAYVLGEDDIVGQDEMDSWAEEPIEETFMETEPGAQEELPVLGLREEDIYGIMDINGDGVPDVAVVDANGNELPDMIIDSSQDGNFDTLVLDSEMDENGDIIIDENNVIGIDGVEIIQDEMTEGPRDNSYVSNEVDNDAPEMEMLDDQLDMELHDNEPIDGLM